MIRSQLSLLAILALLTGSAFAGGRKIAADLQSTKETRAAVKEAVAERNSADVPPEMRTPRTNAKIEKLRLLIVQGIKAGQLTAGEQTSTMNELKRIEREEETYKHNKRVGPRERRDLNRDINKLHERLWEKTHNGAKPASPLAS